VKDSNKQILNNYFRRDTIFDVLKLAYINHK
jgi:hypothetical protein